MQNSQYFKYGHGLNKCLLQIPWNAIPWNSNEGIPGDLGEEAF